jgi:predicted secreted acid phosphatase
MFMRDSAKDCFSSTTIDETEVIVVVGDSLPDFDSESKEDPEATDLSGVPDLGNSL